MITKEKVLDALRHVEEPDLKKDLVTLNMIEDIVIEGNKVSFTVILTTPACPLKDAISNACKNAIAHFVSKDAITQVNMSARTMAQKDQPLNNVANIIAVASGKGGVGKSTVSANLAVSLAKSGARVGLIDADIYGPSIPMMFGLEGTKPFATEDASGKTKIVPPEKFGVKILSIGFFTEPGQPVPWRGPMASNAIKQLFNDADWGELDYLIVDLPPGTGDIHITLSQTYKLAGAVIVTTPQNVALTDTEKGIAMFKMNGINVPVLGVIENMSYFTPAELPANKYYLFGKGGGSKIAAQFNIPFLGEIPLIQSISEAGDGGEPVVLQEGSPSSEAFTTIANQIARQLSIVNASRLETTA